MGCCDDPTEPAKFNRTDLARSQELYGNLVRDLFTGDPEKVILKQLNEANTYLRELAALNAHYESVRRHAIELLNKKSLSILQQIINKEPESEIGLYAKKHLEDLEDLEKKRGFLDKVFN